MTSSSTTTTSDRRLHKPALRSKSTFNLPLCNPERQEAGAKNSSVYSETRPGVNGTLRLVYCSATVCSHLQRSLLLFTLLPSLLATSECEIAASPSFGFQRDSADIMPTVQTFSALQSEVVTSPFVFWLCVDLSQNLHLINYPLLWRCSY